MRWWLKQRQAAPLDHQAGGDVVKGASWLVESMEDAVGFDGNIETHGK